MGLKRILSFLLCVVKLVRDEIRGEKACVIAVIISIIILLIIICGIILPGIQADHVAVQVSDPNQVQNFYKLLLTNNPCYQVGQKIKVSGIMLHSTGVIDPWLKRYVGPNDGLLGDNELNNHWNQPMDREVCVHCFIGKLADGTVAAYQTLPWNYRGWHAGGTANNTHIGIEICEGEDWDIRYFNESYKKAVEVCAYLCLLYRLDPAEYGVIIGHFEGHNQGIASDHKDPEIWLSLFGKSMGDFRLDVKEAVKRQEKPDT